MAVSPKSTDERMWCLRRMAQECGIEEPPALVPLSRPPAPLTPLTPNFKNPDAEFHADEQLRRRRIANAQQQNGSGVGAGIIKKRSFSISRKDSFTNREIFDELDAHVTKQGSPGVAEALIHKLRLAGGDLNNANTKSKTAFHLKRKSTDDSVQTQSRILQKAVENEQVDMVTILVPHADATSIDAVLPAALATGNLKVTEILLSYGANLSSTPQGHFQFQQLCFNGGQADLVGLILRSDGRPPPDWISGAMIAAAGKGDLQTVVRLSRSVADGSLNNAEALRLAIRMCRVDIALAILTGSRPPDKEQLNEAFRQVFAHTNIMPTEKMTLAESLLLAGAEGDVVSEALVKACETEFHAMIDLLISAGASIEYQGALVVRDAIRNGNTSMVELLLSERAVLSPSLAADLIPEIPKRTRPEDRRLILNILLRKGAKGSRLNDALIDATEAQDLECVKLLLTTQFAGSGKLQVNGPNGSHDLKRGPRSMTFERHATADVDYKGGLALSIAVNTGNLAIVEFILAEKPSLETLEQIFPSINQLDRTRRPLLTELFLNAGVSGPCVHTALQQAIDEHPPRRDERLIGRLLQCDIDVNTDKGAPVLSAIEHLDADLLQVLLSKTRLNPRNAATALKKAMAVNDPERTRMVIFLLQAGMDEASQVIGESMNTVLQEQPTDLRLLSALLTLGKADVNNNGGNPLVLAVNNKDPRVLELMLQSGKPNAETMDMAVQAMDSVESTQEKAIKLESILRRTKNKETLNRLLCTEVKKILELPPAERTLVVLNALLDAGVDVNALKAAALCHAVRSADPVITDVLFAAKPNTASLGAAMPYALNIPDQTDRLTFTARLLDAGAPAAEANRALIHAIPKYPTDFALLNRLVAKADMSDGEALLVAVTRGNVDLVELLARSRRHAPAKLNEIFAAAMKVQDIGSRRIICELLLKTGASGQVVSDALLVAAGTGDLALGQLLLNYGASVDHQEGQAVIEACRVGSPDVLTMLLSTKSAVNKGTLERGFQAATEVRDLKKRAHIFRLLLNEGVGGEVVDAQLVSAARYGDDAVDLVQLLLRAGACTDYQGGEAVYNATRCASLGILEMMLAISPAVGEQKKPSPSTLARALKASSKLSTGPRYQVIKWLFAAGLPTSDDVHLALDKVINEEELSIDLVKLLLERGASPTALGCRSLIGAAQKLNLTVLDLFLQKEVPAKDLTWTFQETFVPPAVDTWLSPAGLAVAERLVDKGAYGNGLSGALNISLDYLGSEKDELAQQFVSLLIACNADVNTGKGEILVKAAKTANDHLIRQMLQQGPNVESLSLAFPYIFDREMSEADALEYVTLFTDYRDGETRLDPMFSHPESEPVMFKALSRYPRSAKIIQALLDAGYYHDPMCSARILDEIEEEEQVNLLIWCLLQPQKRVSSGIISMLIEKGARVDFETKLSKTTPLMLAIKERRHDIVKQLVMAGASVDVTDITGNTPLTLTTQIGGELGTKMMSNILAAEPSQNDGSLHNTARDLNMEGLQVLVDFGHEVDFPSPLHGGRTALGELCLHAADSGPLTAAREKAMEKVMMYLIKQGTDLSLLTDGKSVLLLAMESADAVRTTRALLKVGMWKHVSRQWNFYSDGTYTYSPPQYAKRILPQNDTAEQLHTLLRANRAQDVYYANEGPQPDGAIGLPDDIVRVERERKARQERIQLEAQDHARALARTKEVADIHSQIFKQRAQLEDERSQQRQRTDVEAIHEKARLEEQLFNDAVRRQRLERAAALDHESSLTQAEAERRRLVAETEIDAEEKKQKLLLTYETQMSDTRIAQARQMNAVRMQDREDINAFEKEQDNRLRGRMNQERKLIESKTQMAAQLAGLGMPQRQQIGYVSGELD